LINIFKELVLKIVIHFQGDSGGSLVSNNEIFGIISFSFQCASGVPDVLTKVYYYVDYIKSYIDE
jgi:secreted trypsin-like serine protease